MLNDFINWAKSVAASQFRVAIEMRVTVGNASDNPSARLDVDTPSAVARITCWESGDYELEVIDIDSEKQIFAQGGKVETGALLSEQFRSFFEMLGIAIE